MRITNKQLATRLLLVQILIILFISLIALLHSVPVAYSVFIGGGIGFLGNLYFAIKAFRYAGASRAKLIMNSFYMGEAGKLIITAVLFLLALKWIPNINPLALLGGFFAAQSVYWLSPLIFRESNNSL